MDILALKKNYIIVGRASSGIFLILKSLFVGGEVIIPANICYAAVYPVVFAGNIPLFCDVDAVDGNVRMKDIKAKVSSQTKAIIVPHMYGNPIIEIDEIQTFCMQHGIILIEDCASAMGAKLSGRPVGTFGDYVVYSTGYAKTLDLGFGGIIASDVTLSEIAKMERDFNKRIPSWESATFEFSKQYRTFRNSGLRLCMSEFEPYFRQSDFRELFLFRSRPEWQDKINSAVVSRLDAEIQLRIDHAQIYHQAIEWNNVHDLREYKYVTGAVPWRYSLLLAPERRHLFIKTLLGAHIPVSDWYPTITELFANEEVFPNAEHMGNSIVNFPLTVSEKKIQEIGRTISKIMRPE